jgi:hypothetical protein
MLQKKQNFRNVPPKVAKAPRFPPEAGKIFPIFLQVFESLIDRGGGRKPERTNREQFHPFFIFANKLQK